MEVVAPCLSLSAPLMTHNPTTEERSVASPVDAQCPPASILAFFPDGWAPRVQAVAHLKIREHSANYARSACPVWQEAGLRIVR